MNNFVFYQCISKQISWQINIKMTQYICHRVEWNSYCCSQKFGSNQSKPEFTVDLRGGSVEWASKEKSSKKHVIEVLQSHRGSTYTRQSPLISECFGNVKVPNCPTAAEDSTRDGAADPVRDRQRHQRLVPSPHWDHQHTCKNLIWKFSINHLKTSTN